MLILHAPKSCRIVQGTDYPEYTHRYCVISISKGYTAPTSTFSAAPCLCISFQARCEGSVTFLLIEAWSTDSFAAELHSLVIPLPCISISHSLQVNVNPILYIRFCPPKLRTVSAAASSLAAKHNRNGAIALVEVAEALEVPLAASAFPAGAENPQRVFS